jgi:hypothetical protein
VPQCTVHQHHAEGCLNSLVVWCVFLKACTMMELGVRSAVRRRSSDTAKRGGLRPSVIRVRVNDRMSGCTSEWQHQYMRLRHKTEQLLQIPYILRDRFELEILER